MTPGNLTAVGMRWLGLLALAVTRRVHLGRRPVQRQTSERWAVVQDHGRTTFRVQGDESTRYASVGRGRPWQVHGAARCVHGAANTVAPPATADAEAWRPRTFMGARDAVNEFVAYMLEFEPPYHFSYDDWLKQYRRWALEYRIAPCPT